MTVDSEILQVLTRIADAIDAGRQEEERRHAEVMAAIQAASAARSRDIGASGQEKLEALLRIAHKRFGCRQFTVKELLKGERAALVPVFGEEASIAIGKFLALCEGRVNGGLAIRGVGAVRNVRVWQIKEFAGVAGINGGDPRKLPTAPRVTMVK